MSSLPDATRKLAVSPEYCKTASPHDKVHKEECVYTFHSPFTSEQGIVVNLATFVGTIPDLALSDKEEALLVRIVKEQVEKAPTANDDAAAAAPTKLGIGVEGGFASEQDQYETIAKYSVVHLKKNTTNNDVVCEIPYNDDTKTDLPMSLTQAVDAIIHHSGATLQQDVQVWQMEEDPPPVSKYAATLEFVDNGVTISPDPATWKCQKRGDTENVWLNLSTGYMGGGRQHWDGSGGSNGALDHYKETGEKYPLVVKLGTITSDINTADCYSYAADEDGPVLIPNLAELLQKRGIHIGNLTKTTKSTAELEVELNATYAFDAITEQNTRLKTVSGAHLQGLQNLGNSCYLNSVVQALFHMPELASRYAGSTDSSATDVGQHPVLQAVAPAQAADDLVCQSVKLAKALTSGAFAMPLTNDENKDDNVTNNPKYRLAPRMFKHVIGKDHVDFKTGQQQDAAQFLQYYLEQLDRSEKQKAALLQGDGDAAFYPSSHLVSFGVETRSVCTADQKVKYANTADSARETVWSIPIPMELAKVLPDSTDGETKTDDEPEHKRHKATTTNAAAASSNNSTGTASTQDTEKEEEEEEQAKTPTISLQTCLDTWAAETTVPDQKWPHLQNAVHPALRQYRLANLPPYLFVQLQRYTLGPDWQPVKLQVNLSVPKSGDDDYIVDLAPFKSKGGPQPNEELVPKEEEGDDAAAAAAPAAVTIDEGALAQLMDMGFPMNACKRALTAVGGSDVGAATGWVFEHNADPDFNDPLPEPAAAAGDDDDKSGVDDATVNSLVEMLGCFTVDQVRFALKETNGASDRAADWLFSHMDDVDALMIAASENNSGAGAASSSSSSMPPLEDSSDCSTYKLIGLISHIGKHTGSGHYVAHLLVNGKWIIFNDEKVAESEKPPVEHAYLYLFQRTDVAENKDLPYKAHY